MLLCTFMDLLLYEHKHSHEYALLAPCNFVISSQLRGKSCFIEKGVKTSSLTQVFITVIQYSFNIFNMYHIEIKGIVLVLSYVEFTQSNKIFSLIIFVHLYDAENCLYVNNTLITCCKPLLYMSVLLFTNSLKLIRHRHKINPQ